MDEKTTQLRLVKAAKLLDANLSRHDCSLVVIALCDLEEKYNRLAKELPGVKSKINRDYALDCRRLYQAFSTGVLG